jgi:16S rRNA processing protein RimM
LQRLAIGYVARAHGVRGELRVHVHDPASTTLLSVDTIWIGGVEHAVVSARPTNAAVLIAVDGVDDRDAADALRGQPVEVEREAVPLAQGEFFLADLPGCDVVTVRGEPLGKVDRVIAGAQDVMAIVDATHERLLPIVSAFVVSVDVGARRVVVDPPEDLPADPIRKR